MESFSLNDIRAFLDCEKIQTDNVIVNKIASLEKADEKSISFFSGNSYLDDLKKTKAKIIILKKEDANLWHGHSIFHSNPYLAIAKLTELFNPKKKWSYGFNSLAHKGENTSIANESYVGPFCFINDRVTIATGAIIESNVSIGQGASIGKNTRIHPNVTIGDNVKIGENCEIYSSASIGTDGFGYTEDSLGKWIKIPQTGSVVLKDYIDIGSNTVIDRGAIDDTIINSGVKIDNQVQIGHNCIIDEDTIIAGCVGIAGSAHVGSNCKIGGAAMILGHLDIADRTIISPGTMVTKSIKHSGKRYTSIVPSFEHNHWLKIAAKLRNLVKKYE